MMTWTKFSKDIKFCSSMESMRLLMYIWAGLSALPSGAPVVCETQTGKYLNYSHRGLSSIPSQITPDVIVLDLNKNNIRIVPNNTMEKLSRLKTLDLSYNKIQKLEPFAFYGLCQLCFLDLCGNNLSMTYESFPLPVFTYLPDLRILHMEDNIFPGSDNTTYPDRTLQNLKHLHLFYVDTFPGLRLGSGFSLLSSLEEFQSFNGVIDKLGNKSLAALANTKLKKLILVDCGIKIIEIGAFLHLKHLVYLDLSHNKELELTDAMDSLYGLQYFNMTDIKFSDINGAFRQYEDGVLDSTKAKYLKNICIANLDLGQNHITDISSAFIRSLKFPECFKRLSFSGHRLPDVKKTGWVLFAMIRFRYLEYLDMSGTNCHSSMRKRRYVRLGINNGVKGVVHYFIETVKVLNISCITYNFPLDTPVTVRNADSLRVLDMSFNGICVPSISGFENLTVLNISGFDCPQLSPLFLSKFVGLEVLEAKGLRLNKGLQSDPDGILLRHQARLRTLDMADNDLTDLHPDLFSSLRLVKTLNLGNNKFLSIPETVRSMTSLTYLDMSYNSLVTVEKEDREWLGKISHLNKMRNSSLYLSMYGNPLTCTCSTLDFLLWVIDTDIQIELKNNLTCTLENGTKTLIVNLERTIKDMRVACVSPFWLTFSVSVASLTVLALCISIVCYRYRHNIKYWFLTKCRRGAAYEDVPIDDSEYDAFVAYNHQDYEWTCHTLREFLEDDNGYQLCLHHRDFPAGESIQENIVDAVNSSRKIILVISKKYLACDWAEFEIQMAGMRMVQSGRNNVVITIMLEEIPAREMPRALLRMWKNVTFLLWTNDLGDQNIFWGKLREAMARP